MIKSFRSLRVLLAAMMACAVLVVGPNANASCVGGWAHDVLDPVPGTWPIYYGVAMIGSDDGWIAGTGQNLPALQRLTSSGWAPFDAPLLGDSTRLFGADGLATDDVWVVGDAHQYPASNYGIAMHWDGTTWTPQYAVAGSGPTLRDVVMIGSNDVWASGWQFDGDKQRALITHWDGTTWSEAALPVHPGKLQPTLFGIAGTGPNDVWAVGSVWTGTVVKTYVLHWNGAKWREVRSPSEGSDDTLYDVVALATDDAWAVGASSNGSRTLILHWNGSKWNQVPSPSPSNGSSWLSAIASSGDRLLAVGAEVSNETGTGGSLILEWNGNQWRPIAAPAPEEHEGLSAIDGIPSGGGFVAAGYSFQDEFVDSTC